MKKITISLSILPIFLTVTLIIGQMILFNSFTPHIPLIFGIVSAGCIGFYLKIPWKKMEDGMFKVVSIALPSIAVLILVGFTISTWIASGTVATIIVYGLKMISPVYFLASAMLLCAIISLSLGTSWGTTATIGLALMGIGKGFGVPMYWTAGAIVSGAFFGDKVSPLSDTTNLAPAVTGTSVFDHIKNMFPTTVPSMLISFCLYLIAGLFFVDTSSLLTNKSNLFITTLSRDFLISPIFLLPAIIVSALAIKKVPAIPSLFVGSFSGIILALFFQTNSFQQIMSFGFSGYQYSSDVPELFNLLNRGGIESMSWVILLMLIALAFGGILETIGAMSKILSSIKLVIKSFASLQIVSILSSIFINLVSGDPYLAITLPGRMFREEYDLIGYSRLNLSRAVEEGGTLVSPLIPWNASGAFVITALGLNVFDGQLINLLYIPLSFACWLSPLIGMFYAYFGFFSPKNIQGEIATVSSVSDFSIKSKESTKLETIEHV